VLGCLIVCDGQLKEDSSALAYHSEPIIQFDQVRSQIFQSTWSAKKHLEIHQGNLKTSAGFRRDIASQYHTPAGKMTFLGRPRQVRKTTLALAPLKQNHEAAAAFFSWALKHLTGWSPGVADSSHLTWA
jgi:hypothetical protein